VGKQTLCLWEPARKNNAETSRSPLSVSLCERTREQQKMKKHWWVLVALCCAAISVHVAPLLATHSEQDNCSFGTFSNEQYRRLLAEAKRKQAWEWQGLVRENYPTSMLLNSRFDELARGTSDVYERLAIMHAILRALGAEYRTAMPSAMPTEAPYDVAIKQGGVASFHYYLDVNRAGFFAPFLRTANVGAVLYAGAPKPSNPTDTVRYRRGLVSFSILLPNLLDPGPSFDRSPSGEGCPPVPRPDQATYFSPTDKT
jgi:hypothetical protein